VYVRDDGEFAHIYAPVLNNGHFPIAPVELEKHNCLVMRFGAHLDNTWHFLQNKHDIQIIVSGNRIANNGGVVHAWALAGHGIALKSRIDIQAYLDSGALVELLPDYASRPTPIQMLFPPGRAQPRRIKFVADRLAAVLSKYSA
jgi:DNA-binding transcriptional LysR family regulator